VLLVPAVVGLLVTPETVKRQAFRLRLQRLSVPAGVSRLSDRLALILGCALLAGGVGLLALALWIFPLGRVTVPAGRASVPGMETRVKRHFRCNETKPLESLGHVLGPIWCQARGHAPK
jgi:hypothetical protein